MSCVRMLELRLCNIFYAVAAVFNMIRYGHDLLRKGESDWMKRLGNGGRKMERKAQNSNNNGDGECG